MDFFDELLKTEKESSKAPGLVSGIVLENYDEKYPGMVKVEYSAGETGKNKSGWIRGIFIRKQRKPKSL